MPEFCSCGAELPPDARFCHKCGKPQREEIIPDAEPAPPPPVVSATAPTHPPLPLTFRNPIAVRVGLSVASIAAVLISVPFVSWGFLIWLLSAGFISVYMYKWRTGQPLSVRSGARMGWITGVLSSVILTILRTLALALEGTHGFASQVRNQLQSMTVQNSDMRGAVEVLESPAGIAAMFILGVIFMFILFSLLCMAGGALGAKIMSKD
jgi:hypothetical protein